MMAASARAYNAANVMLMRSESTSADTLVAMLASCGAPGMQGPRSVGVGGLEEAVMGGGQKRPFYPIFDTSEDNGDDDGGDDCSHHVEKKRRLTVDQVRALEKNFELENKLEPERKMQLARELGLQPRQVAVWFQNRRARWKTKQLERDYDVLKSDYDNLKVNFDTIVAEKEKLQAEVLQLTSKLQAKEKQRKLAMDGTNGQVFEAEELDVTTTTTTAVNKNNLSPHLDLPLKSELATAKQMVQEYQSQSQQQQLGTSPGTTDSPVKCKDKEGSTSSESNSSEIMNADSPHPIDSGLSPGVDQKLVCSSGFGSGGAGAGAGAGGGGPGDTTSVVDASLVQFAEELCGGRLVVPSHGGGGGFQQRISVKLEDGSNVLQEECNNYFYTIEDHGSLPWWEWP